MRTRSFIEKRKLFFKSSGRRSKRSDTNSSKLLQRKSTAEKILLWFVVSNIRVAKSLPTKDSFYPRQSSFNNRGATRTGRCYSFNTMDVRIVTHKFHRVGCESI